MKCTSQAPVIWLCRLHWPRSTVHPVCGCHSSVKPSREPSYQPAAPSCPQGHCSSRVHTSPVCPGTALGQASCHLPSGWPHSNAFPGLITLSLNTFQRLPQPRPLGMELVVLWHMGPACPSRLISSAQPGPMLGGFSLLHRLPVCVGRLFSSTLHPTLSSSHLLNLYTNQVAPPLRTLLTADRCSRGPWAPVLPTTYLYINPL